MKAHLLRLRQHQMVDDMTDNERERFYVETLCHSDGYIYIWMGVYLSER